MTQSQRSTRLIQAALLVTWFCLPPHENPTTDPFLSILPSLGDTKNGECVYNWRQATPDLSSGFPYFRWANPYQMECGYNYISPTVGAP